MIKPIITFLFVTVLLSGCKPSIIKPTHDLNLADLTDVPQYQILGKMSFSDGKDGGSGLVNWQYNNSYVTAELKALIGSRSWEIQEFNGGAKIESNKGNARFSESAHELISQELGWQVPWNELKAWIKGSPYLPNEAILNATHSGYEIIENGWVIQYSKLKAYEAGDLPTKIIARKNNYSIKVSIKTWNW